MIVVPFKALDVTQIQITKTAAPVTMVICQTNQPIGYLDVLSIDLALVAIVGLAEAKRIADNTNTRVSLLVRLLGHIPSARWPHLIFSRASKTISTLDFTSRYIFLWRRFYFCKSFSIGIMETFIPPYLALHL